MSNVTPLAALEQWIGRELKRSYETALAEPVPDEIQRLLREFPPQH